MPFSILPSILHPPHPAVDPEALRALREELEWADLVRIVTLYLDSLPNRVTAIRTACAQRDGSSLARVAHPLKSASRQLGAQPLGDLCERLEQAGVAGRADQVAEQLPALEQEVVVVQTVLRRFLENG